jgi:NAD(P)-dependent dehydrogenase (short-subunit alcohol dehydrogenase family)
MTRAEGERETPEREIVVVVGAGPGLGLAIARRFAREGASVALLARNAQRLAGMVEELRDAGASGHAFVADAADPDDLRSALRAVRVSLGDPTVLVHHVSVPVPGAPTKLDYAAFTAGLHAGVGALVVAAQELASAMREAGRGTVLVTGSSVAVRPSAAYAGLGVQKAGVRSLAFSLAEELAPDGIHVATVTVMGLIRPGTYYDPERIAEQYWVLHTEPRSAWRTELVYQRP